jgi:hypothetical protein
MTLYKLHWLYRDYLYLWWIGKDTEVVAVVQTASEVHPAFYPMGTRGSFSQAVKRPRREADHSPPASAEVKKMWIYTSIPPYVFIA